MLALIDEAVAWMVARGQTEQWGSIPWSERPAASRRVHEMAGHDLWVALDGDRVVGAVVLGDRPAHVAPVPAREAYVELVVTSRAHSGKGLGGALLDVARAHAAEHGAELLRVDCWAGAPPLVRWYERQGFQPTETFDVDGWVGQVFEQSLVAR